MIDLDELDRLEKAATPGPWVDGLSQPGVRKIAISEHLNDEIATLYGGPDDIGDAPNATLIAAARNALPALIRELRAAREVVKAIKPHLSEHMCWGPHHRVMQMAVDAYDMERSGGTA